MPRPVDQSVLFAEVQELYKLLGHRPSRTEWQRECHRATDTVARYGGFAAFLDAALESIEPRPDFTSEPIPDEDVPLDVLLDRRRTDWQRKSAHRNAVKLINVKVNLDGPVGVAHFGDPHIDDDGTNICELEAHRALVIKTKGMLAANVGDQINNWVGRLARLYGEQATSAKQAWQLCEWFIGGVDWLYLVGGNHDSWSGATDPLKWIKGTSRTIYQPTSVRLNLKFPNGRQVRVNARHDFPGNSMWNPAHGPMKAAQMGWRDHILTCGHKHISGYGPLKCPATGIVSHAVRVASYKYVDGFADAKGFPDGNISPCVTTVINPYAEHERDLVVVLQGLESAADYVTYLRKRFESGRKVAK